MHSHHNSYKNVTEILQEKVNLYPNRIAFEFLNEDKSIEKYSYMDLHNRALTIAGQLNEKCIAGSRILLLYPPSPDLIFAFWGCIYAGVIPVPTTLPLKKNMFAQRLANIIENCQPALCLTNSTIQKLFLLNKIDRFISTLPIIKNLGGNLSRINKFDRNFSFNNLPFILSDKIKSNNNQDIQSCELDDVLFLQYTSGSTNVPKGVIVSHRNMLINSELIKNDFCLNEHSKSMVWIPPYHDMGLMGTVIHPIYVGYSVRIMSPLQFIRDPLIWLEQISEFKANLSGGPNFAYDLCNRFYNEERLKDIDLSCWKTAFCGSELINYNTLADFIKNYTKHKFKKNSFMPCYGLAESTLYVTGIHSYDPESAILVDKEDLKKNQVTVVRESNSAGSRIVSCGLNVNDQDLKIVDADGNELAENQIGKIVIRSLSVAKGYWNNLEATNNVFKFKIKNNNNDYLDTGDLGFINQKQLYITGREKEVMIIHGQNHHPQWIEKKIQDLSPLIRKNCIAVFQIPEISKDRIIVVTEVYNKINEEDFKNLAIQIFRNIYSDFELQIERIVFLGKNGLTKTTSGKIPRANISRQLQNNELEPIYVWHNYTAENYIFTQQFDWQKFNFASFDNQQKYLLDILLKLISDLLQISPKEIKIDDDITNYITDSLMLVDFITRVETCIGVTIPHTIMLEQPVIKHLNSALVKHILKHKNPISEDNSLQTLPLTPMQQFMLDHVGFKEFNIARVVNIAKPITLNTLNEAVKAVVNCQPYLRTRFDEQENKNICYPPGENTYLLDEFYFTTTDKLALKTELDNIIKDKSKLIDVRNGPIFSLSLCHTANNEQKLIFVISHFFVDPYSIRIFLQLLQDFLYTKNLNIEVVSSNIFAEIKLIEEFFSSPKIDDKQAILYLENRQAAKTILSNEIWYNKEDANNNAAEMVHNFKFNMNHSKQFDHISKIHHLDSDTLLLGAFLFSFANFTNQDRFLIQLQHHGRMPENSRSLNNIIAWVNISCPVILQIDPTKPFLNNLYSLQNSILETRNNSFAYNRNYYESDELKQRLIPPDWANIEYSNLGKLNNTKKNLPFFTDCPLFKDEYTHGNTFSHLIKRYRQLFIRPYWIDDSLNISIAYNKNVLTSAFVNDLFKSIHENLETLF